jgi:hypothetical protein
MTKQKKELGRWPEGQLYPNVGQITSISSAEGK